MRMLTIAILAVIAVAALVPIQGTDTAGTSYVIAFYDENRHYIKSAVSYSDKGFILDAEDIPPLPGEEYGYYFDSKPMDGGWINPKYLREWDPSDPLEKATSIYIWDATGMSDEPPPVPTPYEPSNDNDPTGIIILAMASVVFLGAVGIVMIRRK